MTLNVIEAGRPRQLQVNWEMYKAERDFLQECERNMWNRHPYVQPKVTNKGLFDLLSLTNGTNN